MDGTQVFVFMQQVLSYLSHLSSTPDLYTLKVMTGTLSGLGHVVELKMYPEGKVQWTFDE